MKFAVGVEYDGSRFCGWQTQNGVRTVQETVEAALSKVADRPVSVVCAGRTDSGVHALEQVIHFETDAQRPLRAWVYGGNANLPDDVALLWAKAVPDEFHARFSARQRHYRYVIFNRSVRTAVWAERATWCYRPLEVEWMRRAAQHLVGEYDFTSFRARDCQAKNPVRTVTRLEVRRDGPRVILEVSANAFLKHMVRNIAGVLISVGSGKHPPAWAGEVLAARDRTLGGVTAPPQGLFFKQVDYPAEFELSLTEYCHENLPGQMAPEMVPHTVLLAEYPKLPV